MHIRVARHTERFDEVIAFYRDGLGLKLSGSFNGHDGYSGAFLAIPGTGAHLEFTSGPVSTVPTPHPESLVVLYLNDQEAVDAAVARCDAAPVQPGNPYWQGIGATALKDPDGFVVILVPMPWT